MRLKPGVDVHCEYPSLTAFGMQIVMGGWKYELVQGSSGFVSLFGRRPEAPAFLIHWKSGYGRFQARFKVNKKLCAVFRMPQSNQVLFWTQASEQGITSIHDCLRDRTTPSEIELKLFHESEVMTSTQRG